MVTVHQVACPGAGGEPDHDDRVARVRQQLVQHPTARGHTRGGDGIRHVGVDRVIAEAQVTRVTFYRHFPSKEDLVLAHVEQRDQQIRSVVTEAFRTSADPEALLLMMMAGIGAEICGPGFRGCPFINAAAEYPDPEHPVRRAVQAHRSWFRQTVLNLVTAAGCIDSEHITAVLVLLRDGAMAGGDLDDPEPVREHLMRTVSAVLKDGRKEQ